MNRVEKDPSTRVANMARTRASRNILTLKGSIQTSNSSSTSNHMIIILISIQLCQFSQIKSNKCSSSCPNEHHHCLSSNCSSKTRPNRIKHLELLSLQMHAIIISRVDQKAQMQHKNKEISLRRRNLSTMLVVWHTNSRSKNNNHSDRLSREQKNEISNKCQIFC